MIRALVHRAIHCHFCSPSWLLTCCSLLLQTQCHNPHSLSGREIVSQVLHQKTVWKWNSFQLPRDMRLGQIQGKSDWQVPIMLSTVPRHKSLLQTFSHISVPDQSDLSVFSATVFDILHWPHFPGFVVWYFDDETFHFSLVIILLWNWMNMDEKHCCKSCTYLYYVVLSSFWKFFYYFKSQFLFFPGSFHLQSL